MISYWQANSSMILTDTWQHLQLVGGALIIALIIATELIVLCLGHDRWLTVLNYVFSLAYSIPSFALFALLIPITGLGRLTAVIVLVVYCEYVLLRSFVSRIESVDPILIEVAKGMGMTDTQVLIKVQLPLALPSIFGGLQIALASTMGIATIAATINAGGLGELLFAGLQSQAMAPILWGIIATVLLTLIGAGILKMIERVLVSDKVG